MKCPFSKVDCHKCLVNSICEVYETLLSVPILWGKAAEKFEKEMKKPPTKKQREMIKGAQEVFKNIKQI